ncbi:MAG: glycosyltransferase family 39 protein [Gemmatimonadetes bacterium]|nr:glycosyltransferase family 39 protein [Gemmatimonadota bacterium]
MNDFAPGTHSAPHTLDRSHRLLAFAVALVAVRIALPLALIHPAWEFHRDELLYFAMGDHFEPMRMQFPPFIAAVARGARALFGDAVLAARVPAAIGGGALLAAMLWFSRRLGAGAWALGMIALATIAAPIFLRPSVLMQPVIFDQLWATLAIAALALAAVKDEPRWWLLAGIAFGLGALTKFSVAFYIISAAVAAVATPALRRQLSSRWPWVAAGIAAVLALPSITGQVAHDWPFLAQMSSLRGGQLARVSPVAFLAEQPLLLGAACLLVPVAVAAAWRGDTATRVTGTVTLALLALMLVLRGKGYYAAPGYPALLVAAAVWLERRLAARRASLGRRAAQVGFPLAVAVGAVLMLPMGIPTLDPDAMSRFAVSTGVVAAVRTNQGEELALPQDYADMLGWRAMAEAVARAYRALPPAERSEVVIVGSNYGEAGALAMYRDRLGLPYPVSVHGDFHAWGTGGRSGAVTILVDQPDALVQLRELFDDVREVERLQDGRAVPEERDLRIYVARAPRARLGSLWPTLGPRWN